MPTSIMILDDFLNEPYELRNAALSLNYLEEPGNFPGRNSDKRIAINGMDGEISNLVGEPLRGMTAPHAHAKCRISLAKDKAKAKVHVDPSHWSGILYLSRPEDCRGGTEFFRNRASGLERTAYNDEEAKMYGYNSLNEMVDNIGKDSLDDSKWEMTMRVPMRFNRLILFRPWLWHTAGESFGDNLENGRLTYLMFYMSSRL